MKKIPFELQELRIHSPDRNSRTSCNAAVNEKNIIGNSKGERFYNVPCAFDIETTSFYRDTDGRAYTYEQAQRMQDSNGRKAKLEKAAIMYVWQFGINGYLVMGRTWGEFVTMMQTVSEVLAAE